MNSRERIWAAVRGEASDRAPVVPQITYFTADICEATWEEAMNDAETMSDCLRRGWERFGYDGVYAGWESSFNLVANAMGAPMACRPGAIPYIEAPLFTKPSEIDRMRPLEPRSHPRLALHLEATRLLREKVGDSVPVFSYVPGPLTLAGVLIENTNLMKSILLAPAFVRDVVARAAEATCRYAEAKIESGAEIVVIADPSASCSVISPAMFETFARPHLERVATAIRARGALVSIHICGKILPILDSLCSLRPDIVEIDSMNDLVKAREIAGDRVCLQGNIDPAGTLLMGDREKVGRECAIALRDGRRNGSRFILSSGCEVPNRTPLENIEAMVRAAAQ